MSKTRIKKRRKPDRRVRAAYSSYRKIVEEARRVPLPLEMWAFIEMPKAKTQNPRLFQSLVVYTRPLRAKLAAQANAEMEARHKDAEAHGRVIATPATDAEVQADPGAAVKLQPQVLALDPQDPGLSSEINIELVNQMTQHMLSGAVPDLNVHSED